MITGWYTANRILFLKTAIHTNGEVVKIDQTNGRCGGGKRRRRYNCTKYNAQVRFYSENQSANFISISAGSQRGHNQQYSSLKFSLGTSVPVAYDPQDPTSAFHDTFWSIWSIPIFSFLGLIVSTIVSLIETNRPRSNVQI